jgi:hypothetical protein
LSSADLVSMSLGSGSNGNAILLAPSPKPCQFPSWLQSHAQWHTLDQRSTFVFDSNSGLRVYNSSDLSGVGPNSLTMTAMCSQILENPTLSKVMLILHSTADWYVEIVSLPFIEDPLNSCHRNPFPMDPRIHVRKSF